MIFYSILFSQTGAPGRSSGSISGSTHGSSSHGFGAQQGQGPATVTKTLNGNIIPIPPPSTTSKLSSFFGMGPTTSPNGGGGGGGGGGAGKSILGGFNSAGAALGDTYRHATVHTQSYLSIYLL